MSLTSFIPDPKFDEYKEKFNEHFFMKRKDGIIEVRMHTQGQEAKWSLELHRALPQMFEVVGADRENEVMILTGTGNTWIASLDQESFDAIEHEGESGFKQFSYDMYYHDATKLVEKPLWDLDIPTISVINGPGFHTEFALTCDLTICSEDAQFIDPHLYAGLAPGDGQFLVFQQLLGLKRANYAMYMIQNLDAKRALEWGLVNEVLPREKLLDRAWELAETVVNRNPRIVRRMTTQIAKRPWRRLFTDDFSMHIAHEMYAIHISMQQHGGKSADSLWKKKK
ncbi:MAG: enoyl-CoA hydratase/isomerase family protein [bacterium]